MKVGGGREGGKQKLMWREKMRKWRGKIIGGNKEREAEMRRDVAREECLAFPH